VVLRNQIGATMASHGNAKVENLDIGIAPANQWGCVHPGCKKDALVYIEISPHTEMAFCQDHGRMVAAAITDCIEEAERDRGISDTDEGP
jgi:hypothetical protein